MPTINQTSLRWALALAAFLALFAGLATGARATTGGASSAPGAASGEELAFSPYRYGGASWYGPGLWGHKTACGKTLQPGTLGVAHKSLPCGTTVKFVYHGHVLVTQVIDRGPYSKGEPGT
jgi:peptidoglycan lytic transglycosylase